MNLVLVGLRGAGKTTVGALLAARLGLQLVDLDRQVERETGQSVAAIFGTRGEAAFRRRESEALRKLAGRRGLVIATGGGVVLAADNRVLIPTLGLVAWLQVSPAQAARRLAQSYGRPALTAPSARMTAVEAAEHEAEVMARQRAQYYRQVAKDGVACRTDGRTAEQICDELADLWRQRRATGGAAS